MTVRSNNFVTAVRRDHSHQQSVCAAESLTLIAITRLGRRYVQAYFHVFCYLTEIGLRLLTAVASMGSVRCLDISSWVFMIAVLAFIAPIDVARCRVGVAVAIFRVAVTVSMCAYVKSRRL